MTLAGRPRNLKAVALAALVAAALALAISLAAATTPRQAGAAHVAKRCGTVKGYPARARAVTCRYARAWIARWLRDRTKAPGYTCVRSNGSAVFYCTNGPNKAYWVLRK